MSHQPIAHTFTTPEWVKHSVFYQIFVDRFSNGDELNDPENVVPWGSTPTPSNLMGGDLQGIINRLDYLTSLGVNALYLNPIFHSPSNHKYNTYDYFQIDPHFGDLTTFHKLIVQCHQRGIKVVLDGVFNHCGRGFFAFNNIIENGECSPYRNWFHIHTFPISPYDPDKPANYDCWWNLPSLPKFNVRHPPTRRYILDVARYWIEQGADGWRLDVPNEIDDHEFWREFRQVVKEANPDAYIVGEIWEDGTPWLDGTQFDAVMNYLFRDLCRDYFARETLRTDQFASGIETLLRRYPQDVTYAQLNLLGSHDTARFRTEADGDYHKLYAAFLFQMTFPGSPCIYYGDEIGMKGGQDPLCRGAFPWNGAIWNTDLLNWTKQCVAIRHEHSALRTGEFRTLLASTEHHVYAFARWNEEERLIIVINSSSTNQRLDIPVRVMPLETTTLRNLLGNQEYHVQGGMIKSVEVPGRSGLVLLAT
jgi:glycosidase